jgi:hypothetical protein
LANFHMVVGIEAAVHGDESSGWTAVGKHADQDKIRIMDPLEGRISGDIKSRLRKQRDASLGRLQVGVKLVVNIF